MGFQILQVPVPSDPRGASVEMTMLDPSGRESLDNSSSRQHNFAPASLEMYLKGGVLVKLFHSFFHRMCLLLMFIKTHISSIFFIHLF